MADITLQNNQSLTLRLKACGLSSADVKKVLAALSPELENKANTDFENVDVEVFKAKADAAGVGGGSVSSVNRQTGDVNLTASDVGAITEEEVESLINDSHSAVVFPRFQVLEEEVATKATDDLSNVSDDDFLAKLNAVLPDGDEVSY